MGAILGIFPDLNVTGGVQASGRTAWDGILAAQDGSLASVWTFPSAHLFSYPGDRLADTLGSRGRVVKVATRPRAALAATRHTWPVQTVLVWHIGLLKLLPFFRIGHARVVLFLHGVEAWRHQGWLTRRLLSRVDLFLSNSDYTWQRFGTAVAGHPAAGHQTVHLGLDEPLHGASPPCGARPIALMLGRIARGEDYKGHREVLAAWPLVRERLPEAELWIAGDGDLRAQLEQLAIDLRLGQSVRLWGAVSDADKQELLGHSRCMVLPSRGEGFGLVYLEAMRLGRPCLVSTVDAGREVVDPPTAGLAADPGKPHELAAALHRLLTAGPEWERWSQAARARYEAYFTATHFQHRLLGALTASVGRRRA